MLMASNGPVDAAARAGVRMPAGRSIDEAAWMACAPGRAALRRRRNARPTASGATARRTGFPPAIASFDPQALDAGRSVFTSSRSWRFVVNFSQPIFDGGQRAACGGFAKRTLNASRLALQALQIQARSEVRLAQETVRSTERAFESLRSAAQQATEVLKHHELRVRGRRDDEPGSDRRAAPGARRGFGGSVSQKMRCGARSWIC